MQAKMAQKDFISELQEEAARQAKLNNKQLLPSSLHPITSLIGNYPWQCLLISSGLTALVLQFLQL